MSTQKLHAADQLPADTTDPDGIVATLAQFETCLESPVIPGELATWVETVKKTFEGASAALRQEINESHQREFTQIGREDPELLRQVEQLREEDAKLLQQSDAFQARVRRFRDNVDGTEPHESKLDKHVAELVNDGIALVIRIRKQRQAIRIWLLEAYNRDTGIGD